MPSNKISRRNFLRISSLGMASPLLPGWRPRLVFSPTLEPSDHDLLVCIFLRGAMDGLNAVFPHAEQAYYDARPTLAIPEPQTGNDQAGIELNGQFSFHPALRPLLEPYQQGHLAVIHACGSPDPTHSHFDAMDFMERGTPGEKNLPSGWITRHLQTASWENNAPLRAIGIGTSLQASLRGPIQAVALKAVDEYRLPGDPQGVSFFQESLHSLYSLPVSDPEIFPELSRTAQTTFDTMELLEGLDSESYAPEGNAEYAEDEFGQGLKQIAFLAKADIGLEVACLDLGGWDTHADQGVDQGKMPGLLSTLAAGLSAFYTDMNAHLDNFTLVTMTEFGRRVAENGNGGTDHGHGGVMFVMGGGIRGGKVFTDWPGLDHERLFGPGDLAVTTDFRDVIGEILVNRLGNDDLESVFPGHDSTNFLGFSEARS